MKIYKAIVAFIFVVAALMQPATAQESFTKTHEELRQSLVHIELSGIAEGGLEVGWSATGTIISKTGHVLTVQHLLKDAPKFIALEKATITGSIQSKDKLRIPMTIIEKDEQRDVLILKFDDIGLPFTAACLDFEHRLQVGDMIGTSGFPDAANYYFDGGILKSKYGHPSMPSLWQTDLVFNRGQSGSPVYTLNGNIIGIANGEVNGARGIYYFQEVRQIGDIVRSIATPCVPSQKTEPDWVGDYLELFVTGVTWISATQSVKISIRLRNKYSDFSRVAIVPLLTIITDTNSNRFSHKFEAENIYDKCTKEWLGICTSFNNSRGTPIGPKQNLKFSFSANSFNVKKPESISVVLGFIHSVDGVEPKFEKIKLFDLKVL